MRRRVKVTLPKGKKGLEARTSGLEVRMSPGLGFNANQLSWPVMAGEFSQPEVETNSSIKAVPRDQANLEAEVGETAVTNFSGDGIPEHYKIGGKRHSEGGTPLYLPDNSFIFSRDRSMKIKDPDIINQFGMSPKKGGYTPADIAKKYDINKFKKILGDPNTDDLQRKTAEAMISGYNLKLGKLALAQESIKGFPQGIPAIAMPYLEHMGIQPDQLVQQAPSQMSQQEEDTEQNEDQQVESQEEVEMPEGRYGMNIISQIPKKAFGGGLNRFVKGGSNKRRVKVTMPMFQGGGQAIKTDPEPAKSKAVGIVKFDTEDALYQTPNVESIVQSGNAYLRGEDGKYYRVDYLPPRVDVDQEKYNPLKTDQGDFRDDYAYLENEVLNSPDIQDAIWNNYQEQIKNVKTESTKTALTKKTKEDVISDFLNMQFQNFAMRAQGEDLNAANWQNKSNPAKAYQTSIEKAGLKAMDPVTVASGQAAYAAFVQASKDEKTKDLFSIIVPEQTGVGDESYVADKKTISPPDGVMGNTTAGQLATVKIRLGDALSAKEETTDFQPKHLDKPQYTGAPSFWLQDIIGTAGAARDLMGIKKQMPWQATPETYLPEPTFYSPERELAAAQEQAGTLTQGLAAFTGPKTLSSRASAIQGQTAKAAADILGRYNNLNVGVANQFELQKTSILNQAAERNAALATQLYDKTAIANEQFDASKTAARQNVRNQYLQAISNRANTYNLNTLYPQYAVDPLSGGMIDFTHGADITPDASESPDIMKLAQSYLEKYPSFTTAQAYDAAKLTLGLGKSSANAGAPEGYPG